MLRTSAVWGAIALFVLGTPSPAPADSIYSNLGPGDSFDAGTAFSIAAPMYGGSNVAMPFLVSGTDFQFTSVEMALQRVIGGPPFSVFNVLLLDDAGGMPGTVIDAIALTVTDVPTTPSLVTATSALQPTLTAGNTYWVATDVGGNFAGGWFFSSPPATGAMASRLAGSGGPWTVIPEQTLAAFRVNGDPVGAAAVPEPSSLALAMSALVALAGFARFRRASGLAASFVGSRERPAAGFQQERIMSSKFAGLLVVACVWAASPSPARAEDRKADVVALATFLSEEYRDAAKIVRVPVRGGRMLLKRPLPATEPNRDKAMQQRVIAQIGSDMGEAVCQAWADYQLAVRIINAFDKLIGTAGPSMTPETMKRIEAKVKQKDLVDVIKEVRDFKKTLNELAEGKKHIKEAIDDRILKAAEIDDESLIKKHLGYAFEFYKVGYSQMTRYIVQNDLQAKFQKVWDEGLLADLEKSAGPAFDKPALEVARTQLAEETGSGRAVVWRGLCVTNVGSRALTNLTLDLTLTAGADEKLRRTWFFPAMKPRQTFILYVNDRAFGSGGHTAQADSLLAEVRALCDEGRQGAKTYKLLKDGRGHLGKGTAKLMSAEAMKAEAKAVALFRALAEKEKAVTFTGGRGAGRVELRFAKPTEPLLSLGGKPLVSPERYLRITLTGASKKEPIELDGHPEPAGGKVELLSHLNVNGAVEPVARSYDRNYGSLTIEDGKLTLRIHKMTYTAPVADTDISLESLPADRSPSGGVPRRRPDSTPAPAKLPSLEGTWAATFKNGSKADFTFTRDRKFTGTNGATGTWSQSGRKVRVSVSGSPDVWEGEIAEDGKSLVATTAAGGRVTATRK